MRVTSHEAQDQSGVLPGERAKAIASLEILLRMIRKAVDCFPEDDLETIVVALTVAVASSGRHLRDPAILDLMTDENLPPDLLRPTSGRAIAEATGLPRESVRRRIDQLVAAGRLTREAGGVRMSEGALQRNRNLEFVRFLIQEMDTASARIRRFDIP